MSIWQIMEYITKHQEEKKTIPTEIDEFSILLILNPKISFHYTSLASLLLLSLRSLFAILVGYLIKQRFEIVEVKCASTSVLYKIATKSNRGKKLRRLFWDFKNWQFKPQNCLFSIKKKASITLFPKWYVHWCKIQLRRIKKSH